MATQISFLDGRDPLAAAVSVKCEIKEYLSGLTGDDLVQEIKWRTV